MYLFFVQLSLTILWFFFLLHVLHWLEYLDCIQCLIAIIEKEKTIPTCKRTADVLSHSYVIKTNYLGVGHKNIFHSQCVEWQLKDLILTEEGRTWNSFCRSYVFGEWVLWNCESNFLAFRDIGMSLKCQVMRIAWPGCCRFHLGTGWGNAVQHHSEQ